MSHGRRCLNGRQGVHSSRQRGKEKRNSIGEGKGGWVREFQRVGKGKSKEKNLFVRVKTEEFTEKKTKTGGRRLVK